MVIKELVPIYSENRTKHKYKMRIYYILKYG
jgi:hypothetical protein